MRRRPLPIAALAVVLGLAGCGGAEEVAREPAHAGGSAADGERTGGRGRAAATPAVVSADPWVHLRDVVALGPRPAGGRAVAAAEDLVAARLRAAGWRVRFEEVRFPEFRERRSPRVVPAGGERVARVRTLQYSPGGRVEARVREVGGRRADAGCRASDWAGFPRGRVALVRRGTCEFRVKARRAQAAGAAAVLVEDPAGPVRGSLREPGLRVPVVAIGAAGADAVRRAGRVAIRVDAVSRRATDRNVLAELPGRDAAAAAVVAGAHLDSVPDGPGANDNASGVAALLAVAARLRAERPARTVRLGFWAAEELGLHGSRAHVRGLRARGRGALPAAYLNFDMVAGEGARRETYGSGRPERVLRAAVRAARDGALGRAAVGGGSDHAPFARAGVPVAGLYAGAGDRCYHRACDRAGNVVRADLAAVARAAAAALRTLAG